MKLNKYILILFTCLAISAQASIELNQVISPNLFVEGTQSERIQKAVDMAVNSGGKLVIPSYDEVEHSFVWLLDKAILLPSNIHLVLDNCTLKLSDLSRDNFIRSANVGLGIRDIETLHNISITGLGHVLLEGADNPRSTGDHNKTLSLTPSGTSSYGSDAGKINENQKGGWRNHGIILAHVNRFQVSGLRLKDYHGHGLVLERSSKGIVRDIHFDVRQSVTIHGVEQQILNQDGVGIRFGCKNIIIENLSGRSGDDFINIGLTDTGGEAGEENVNVVSGSKYRGDIDNISNIYLQNWQDFYSISHRAIRIMPIGELKIENVFIENMIINKESFRGLNVQYAENMKRLFVNNIVTYKPIVATGIKEAAFRNIFYIGTEQPIDVETSGSVIVDHVLRVPK